MTRTGTAPRVTSAQLRRLALYLALSAVVLLSVALPTYKFQGRGYSDDEAWVVFGSLNPPERIVALMIPGVKPPLFHLLLSGWLGAFGHTEPIARYLMSLLLLLSLAFTYQLGRVLFNRLAGTWAMLLLGLTPLVQFYGHQTNVYGLMLLTTAGGSAALLLWLRSGRPVYTVLYVLLALVGVYTHYFGTYVVLAQALFILIFVRPRWAWRAFVLFGIVGVGFVLGWGLIVVHDLLGLSVGGASQFVTGNLYDIAASLYGDFRSRPTGVLTIAVLAGIVTALAPGIRAVYTEALRWGHHWRKGFALAMIGGIVGIAWALNLYVSSLTARNLLVLMPFLGVLGGYGLAAAPRRWQWIILLVLIPTNLTSFWTPGARSNYNRVNTFMANEFQVGDSVFIDIPYRAGQIATTYYVRERNPAGVSLPPSDIYHVLNPSEYAVTAPLSPSPLVNVAMDGSLATRDKVEAHIEERERVWYFQIDVQAATPAMHNTIERDFAVVRTESLTKGFYATLWERIPMANTGYGFGEDIELVTWRLASPYTVQPCETVRLQSWWRIPVDEDLDDNYSLGMKLVKDGVPVNAEDNQLTDVLTGQWNDGRTYIDRSAVRVPCDAVPGAYDVLLVVYAPNAPAEPLRVSLPGDDGADVSDWAYLTTITVTQP